MPQDFDVLADKPIDGIEEQKDGSALITDLPEEPSEAAGHFDNLAESLDAFTLNQIASDLLDLVEKDKEARVQRDKQQEEGIRRTGLGADAPGGATFDGASRVVHPILAEGCVDFSARAIKELFPANGPVKTKIYGQQNDAVLEKAKRKRDFLNKYLTVRMPEYRAEKEVLLTQLPLGGSQYEKFWYDFSKKRVCMEFVPIDKVFLPYSASSFYTSPRITYEQELTEAIVEERVESGFYADTFSPSDAAPEETASQSVTNKIEGKEDSGYNEDGVRVVYEITCMWDVEGDERAPYVVHLDEPTGKIVAIYRNWKEQDPNREPLLWFVENKFIPWRGAYGIGLPHLIGGLAASLTGALRALLDSAHINNAPSAIKLKGGRASGQNVSVDLTAVTEIEAPAGVDDIRKVMMPLPFNPPSQVLFQLLDWITAQAKGVVATAEEKISDVSDRMPVGTALALIEQGSQVFSSIHARLHESQRRALKIICRLIAEYPEGCAEDLAKFGLTAQDFLETDDIDPVSDPNIFSESQRFAQIQAVLQLASGDAQDPSIPWNKLAMRRRMLELLRIDGIDELLPKPPKPITADPVAENVACMEGKVVKANIVQDHLAHIKTHLLFIHQPLVAQGPVGTGQQIGALFAHVQEHLVLAYQHAWQTAMMIVQAKNPGQSPDQMSMQAAMMAQDQVSQTAQGLLPLLQEAQQIVQKKMPQPPMDPAIKATFDAAMAEINRKAAVDKANMQRENAKVAAEQQASQMENILAPRLEQMKGDMQAKLEVLKIQADQGAEQLRQQVEVMKNDADNKQHQMTELLKNRDDNETALQVKLLELQHSVESIRSTPVEAPSAPDFSPMLKQMQDMLGQIEKAKTNDALTSLMQGMHGVMSHMSAPTEVIRDANGKAIGMRKAQASSLNLTNQ